MAGRRPASRRGSSRGSSSFGSFLAGLTLGLVVALVVYLNPRPDQLLARRSPENRAPESNTDLTASPKKDADRRANEKSDRQRGAKYDFYSILPETEDEAAAHRASSHRAHTAAKPAERKESPSRPAAASAERAPVGVSQSGPQATAPKAQAPAEPVAKLEPAAPAPRPPAPAAKAQSSYAAYYLQVGAFRQIAEAEKTRAQLALLGVSGKVQRSSVAGQEVYRVRVGPFHGSDAAQEARQRLSENGVRYVVVGDRRAYSDGSRQPP